MLTPPQPLRKHATTTLAIVGVLSSNFFTFLSSRNESAASYTAMKVSVKELQDATYECALENAKLEGRLDAIEAVGNARHLRARQETDVSKALRILSDPMPLDAAPADAGRAEPVKLPAPPSFNQAVEQYKEKL